MATAATIPSSGLGDVTWTDVTNNWTAEDAKWLQDRSVVRYSGNAPSLTGEGRVFYNTTNNRMVFNSKRGATAVVKQIMASDKLGVLDTSTTDFTLKAWQRDFANAGDITGVTFSQSTDTVYIPDLTFKVGRVGTTGLLATGHDLVLNVDSNTHNVRVKTGTVVWGDTGTATKNAWVILGGTQPAATDVPEGTLYIS